MAESTDGHIVRAGAEMVALMRTLMDAIYEAREKPPPEPLPVGTPPTSKLCEAHHGDAHDALRSFARELHYDWKVMLRPLAEPHLPLSNNAAGRAVTQLNANASPAPQTPAMHFRRRPHLTCARCCSTPGRPPGHSCDTCRAPDAGRPACH